MKMRKRLLLPLLIAMCCLLCACATHPSLGSPLETAVHTAVMKENAGRYQPGEFRTESHLVLNTETSGTSTTVYAWVLYLEYSRRDGVIEDISGGHTPVALTFAKNSGGEYRLTEYWEAQDGDSYVSSIKKKFPFYLWNDAIHPQKYMVEQQKECDAKADAYFAAQKKKD